MKTGSKIAVFLDRDGVINKAIKRPDGSFTAAWTADEFQVFPDAPAAIARIREMGMLSVIVTNQPDVGYGNMTPPAMNEIMRRTRELGFDVVYVCDHGRDDGCRCKKPKPGMLLRAAAEHDIDLPKSYIIGDTKSDAGAGKAAGCKTILIARSYNESDRETADVVVAGLAEGLDWVKQDRAGSK